MSYLVNIGTTDTELRGIKPYLRHVKISADQLIEMMKLYTESELRHDAYILGGNYEDFIAELMVDSDEYFHSIHPKINRKEVEFVVYTKELFTSSSDPNVVFLERRKFEDFIVTYFGNIKKFIELASNGYWEEHS